MAARLLSFAHDIAQQSSVNIVELATCWHTSEAEDWTILFGFLLRRCWQAIDGKRHGISASASLEMEPTTLRQHHGRLDTSADIRRLENGQFILLFIANDGHWAIVDFHGNRLVLRSPDVTPLPQAWRQPSSVSSLLFAVGFKDWRGCKRAGRCQRCRRKNGGRTADERHLKPCCQALDGRPTTLRQLQSSGHVGRLQTMEFFDNSLRFSSPTTAELLLFTFATVLSKLGSDQPLINLFACRLRRQLSLLSHHPLYAQLDSKSNTYARPFKKYDRATISHGRPRAGQRFWVSLPAEINGFVAGKRGLFSVNTEDLRLPDQLTTVSAMIADHLLSSRHPLLFRQVFGLDSKDLGGF